MTKKMVLMVGMLCLLGGARVWGMESNLSDREQKVIDAQSNLIEVNSMLRNVSHWTYGDYRTLVILAHDLGEVIRGIKTMSPEECEKLDTELKSTDKKQKN